ncbi:MAG: phosphopantetheine-binding protein, partial [Alphaproteobacteria bacterium]
YPIPYAGPPAAVEEMPTVASEVTPTGDSIEALVTGALASALGIAEAELPLNKPLQTLGFNSIAAMELKYRLEAALHQEIGLELIGDTSRSVAGLVRLLADTVQEAGEDQCGDNGEVQASSLQLPVLLPQPEARYEPFPLTDMQEAFLIGRQAVIGGDRTGAHVYLEIDVNETLDIFRLNRAWARLIVRHDMLRAIIADGMQKVLPSVRNYRFKVIDLRKLDEGERQQKAANLRRAMEAHIFSGEEWPLFDIRVSLHAT